MKFIRIKETCLYVADLARSRDFYEGKLGLELISFVEGRHVFFRAGDSVLLCFDPDVTRRDTKLPPHWGAGKLHLAFECEPTEYQNWKNRVEDAEIEIVQEAEWTRGLRSFYFEDPDGHVLEIVQEGIWEA